MESYEGQIRAVLDRALGGRLAPTDSAQVSTGLDLLANHRLLGVLVDGSPSQRVRSLRSEIGRLLVLDPGGFTPAMARTFGAPPVAHEIAVAICVRDQGRTAAAHAAGADASRVSGTLGELVDALARWLASERATAQSSRSSPAADRPLLIMSSEFIGTKPGATLRYETQRLLDSAAERGLNPISINPSFIRISIRNNSCSVDYWDPDHPDLRSIFGEASALLVRGRWGFVDQTSDIVNAVSLAHSRLPIFDPVGTYDQFTSVASLISRVQNGIPMPDTLVVPGNAVTASQLDLSLPMITKGNESRSGLSIGRLRSLQDVAAYAASLRSVAPQDMRDSYGALAQEEILNGREFRVFVIAGKAFVAAERLRAALGGDPTSEFLSENVDFAETTISDAVRSVAEAASRASGASFSGVDVFETDDGRALVIESNRNPQFKKLEQSTRTDVAGAMLDYVESESVTQS